jgi:hypothetical protein
MRYLAIIVCVAAIAAPAAFAKGRISITLSDSTPSVGQQFTVRVRTGWVVPVARSFCRACRSRHRIGRRTSASREGAAASASPGMRWTWSMPETANGRRSGRTSPSTQGTSQRRSDSPTPHKVFVRNGWTGCSRRLVRKLSFSVRTGGRQDRDGRACTELSERRRAG